MRKSKGHVHILIDDGPNGATVTPYLNEHDAQSAYIGLVLEDDEVPRQEKAVIRAAKDHSVRYRLASDAYHAVHDDGCLDYSYYIESKEVQ